MNWATTKTIEGELDGKFVTQDEFYEHLRLTVFCPVLGCNVSKKDIKDIVVGIGDQILFLVMSGAKVRLGRLGMFVPHTMPAGSRYNPITGEKFHAEKREKMMFRASKSTKRSFGYMQDSDSVSDG